MEMNLKNAIINKISTLKDRSVKIELITRELTPQQMAELFLNANNEMLSIDIPEDAWELKSKAQRLRWVLYKVWETSKKDKFTTFTLYYDHIMEQLIDKYKEHIIE